MLFSTLEVAARGILNDPSWNWVFKNTFDAVEERLNKILIAVASVGVAVKCLSNLASGDILCIVNSIIGNDTQLDLTIIAGPFHGSLSAYAAQEPVCYNRVFSAPSLPIVGFMKYGPVFLLLQAISLIAAERTSILFPRMSQKLERFYKSVVEEALLGRDPDVAEDFSNGQFSTDKILRERQRQEICGALNGSSTYYYTFMSKNILEIVMGIIYIVVNVVIAMESQDETKICQIPLLNKDSSILMQCRQKRYDIFINLLWVFIVLLIIHVFCNICSFIWGLPIMGLRKISTLIKELQQAIISSKSSFSSFKFIVKRTKDIELGLSGGEEKVRRRSTHTSSNLIDIAGKDFCFLFDLISCTCGKAATLRVLSYTAPSFEKLCQPRIQIGKTEKTETSLKIQWQTARLQEIRSYQKLEVAEYIATISPGYNWKSLSENTREAEFKNLEGGTTRYTITVSAIVGQAKMKGTTLTTFLPPFPPQNLQCYPSPNVTNKTTSIKITWTTPRGEFHKYSLRIALIDAHSAPFRNMSTKLNNLLGRNGSKRMPDEIWLPKDANDHTAENVKPGERYQIELKSMTEFQKCMDEKAPKALVLTKPLPPSNIRIQEGVDQAALEWSPPEGWGHSCLVGYKIQLRIKGDGKCIQDDFISTSHPRSAVFKELVSTMEYEISLATVCRNKHCQHADNMVIQASEIMSDFITKTFVAPPRSPLNLRLESSQPNSLKLKWDTPLDCNVKPTYNIILHPENKKIQELIGEEVIKETEQNTFTFSKLPERVGAGKPYEVSVKTVINIGAKFYHSAPTKKVFMTKPLPPENLTVNCKSHEFSWLRSRTAEVKSYKFKIKKEDEKANEYIVNDDTIQEESFEESGSVEMHLVTFKVPYKFEVGIEYKINVFSLLEFEGTMVESDPRHARLIKEYENTELITDSENEMSPARRRSILIMMRNSARNERRVSCFDLPATARQNTFDKQNLSGLHKSNLDIPNEMTYLKPGGLVTATRRQSEVNFPVPRFSTTSKYWGRVPTKNIVNGTLGKIF